MKPDSIRVVLIVDNPFRDLEGITLVARELARRGASTWLVSMYDQPFDVPAIRPHVVVANYVRANNRHLLTRYRAQGAGVVILDTEGNGGEHCAEYAEAIRREHAEHIVDRYCLWGREQTEAFLAGAGLAPGQIVQTGSPRHDLYTPRWRNYVSALGPDSRDYLLINTNFPIVNPRFDPDTDSVVRAWVRAGIDEKFARDFAADAQVLHPRYIEVIEGVVRRFPDARFVLRPHPFERPDFYDHLGKKYPNLQVIQRGQSLDWVRASRAVLHLNCATGIEAVMLGVETVAFEWINTPVARQKIASSVSHAALSPDDLYDQVGRLLAGERLPVTPELQAMRDHYIFGRYELDGLSASRVADSVMELARTRRWRDSSTAGLSGKELTRSLLGYRLSTRMQEWMGRTGRVQRKGKRFAAEEVAAILERLDAADSAAVHCAVHAGRRPGYLIRRRASGNAVAVTPRGKV